MTDPSSREIPRFWHEDPKQQKEDLQARRRQRAILVRLVLIMTLIGSILAMLTWIHLATKSRLVALWVATPQARSLPPVSMGVDDLESLIQGDYFVRPREPIPPSQGRARLESYLAELKEIGSSQPVVVYVRALACVDSAPDALDQSPGKSRLMVLPADADPSNPAGWLPLKSILESLAQSRVRRKLLVLDIMQKVRDPRLELLSADVASWALEELNAVPDGSRLALISCSPGQSTEDSDILGRSSFSFFLEEGLRGSADGQGTDGTSDGIVTVAELAAFVGTHVDDWARRNRGTHQRPRLLGSIQTLNFPLVVLASGKPQPHLTIPESADYPAWLLAGWRLRDQWAADGSSKVAPWAFRRMQALLVRAEETWRSRGAAEDVIEKDLSNQLEELERHWGEVRKGPRPTPRTLGLESMLGLAPDLSLADDLRRLIESLDEEAPTGKEAEFARAKTARIDAFIDRTKQVDERKLAWTVFLQATSDLRPSPERILILDGILRRRRREPRYLETLALRRAALLAEQAVAGGTQITSTWSAWRPEAIHGGLEVARLAGLAENRPVPLYWVRPLLNDAAGSREEAEILLWQPGYAPPESAQARLDLAISRYNTVRSIQDAVEQGWDLVDDAMSVLPSFSALLKKSPEMEGVWRTAIQETRNLYSLLLADPKITKDSTSAGPEVKAVESLNSSLKEHLAELRGFALDLRRQLIRQSALPEAEGSICTTIDTFLETPFPTAQERVDLWKAGHDLARKLLEESLAIAWQPNPAGSVAASQDDDSETAAEASEGEVLRTARWSIDLLQLGGLDVENLEVALRRASEPASEPEAEAASASPTAVAYPVDLARRLFWAWSKELPQALESKLKDDSDLIAADRLSRIVPPLDQFDRLADPRTNPTWRWRTRQLAQLWTWLAELYEDESRDLDASPLLAEAAMGCRDVATPTPHPLVQFTAEPPLTGLTDEHPRARLELNYRVVSPRPVQALIEPFAVTPTWLKVSPLPPSPSPQRGEIRNFPFLVELNPEGPHSRTRPPKGFLVRARLGDRATHARVKLDVESSADKLRAVLSSDPNKPAGVMSAVRVRPAKGLQPYYLFVINPTDRVRKVKVIVRTGEVQVPGGTADLTVNGASSARVNFSAPGAPPTAATPTNPGAANPGANPTLLVEVSGPLTLTLLDADSGKILSQSQLDVSIASPGEYVRLVDARFEPPSARNKGKNQFVAMLRSLGLSSSPPIKAELVLPASRIPGLKGVSDGDLRAELDPRTGEATLMARNLQLDENASELGYAYINIDDVKRAYVLDTTFARHGDPTTPRIDFAPDLRVAASPVARSGSSYKVSIEVDNPPPDASLRISLGRLELAGFVSERDFAPRGPHDRRLGVGVAQGAIAFEAAVSDWSIPIDTEGLSGRVAVRAVLLDRTGREIKTVIHPVVLEANAPGDVHIVDAPVQGRRGSQVMVKAVGKPSESGTKEVNFFWGKPVDGKLPPNTEPVQASPSDRAGTAWSAKVTLPEDKKGPTPLSVQFVSAAGASTFDSRTIEIVDADPTLFGRLRIKVLEGDRPQSGLSVVVQDAKGAVKQQGETGPDGVYLTGNIEQGEYRVSSAKPATPSVGQSTVAVVGGRTRSVTLDLFYRRLR